MSASIPPSSALPIAPVVPSHAEGTPTPPPAGAAAAGSSFAASAQAAGVQPSPAGNAEGAPTPPPSTASSSTGGASAPAPAPTSPAPATTPTAAVAAASGIASTAQVAHIVAATQAALSSSVNLSPQAQQAVKVEAFHQLVANLVNQVQAGATTLPHNWPTAGVSPQLHMLVTALLQQATANQPLPQQVVSVQAWPTALANAVLQLAGQASNAGASAAASHHLLNAALPAGTAGTAAPASTTDIRLPALQNWLVQQGTVQAADGERSFTLTLRVPVAWAQAQSALGAASAAGAAPLSSVLSGAPSIPGFGAPLGGGLLPLPFAGSVQQLSSGSMGLVMQPQLLPGSPAAAAAQAMRTSAILALEFQPLAQAVQSAQVASVYMPSHLQPQELQAMLQNRVTDPWLMMAQAEASGYGKKLPKNANEHNQNFCNRAGCQYQGRAICAQPFCAEMNYLWSVDRAHRSTRL